MKKLTYLALSVAITLSLAAQKAPDLNMHHANNKATSGKARTSNLVNHGGPVMAGAHVVCLFWGTNNMSASYISAMQSFRDNGIVPHSGMLAQYGASAASPLGTGADVMVATPPSSTKVTDSQVQAFVAAHEGFRPSNENVVYEVFIPSGWYSDDGTGAQSCGGTNLKYCAYHSSGDGSNLDTNAKYSIQPYPSCSGCSATGWTTNQNANHFAVHESREAFSDPLGTGWWDNSGNEADDKCAWTGLFISNGYGYQPEWSNSARGCVQ